MKIKFLSLCILLVGTGCAKKQEPIHCMDGTHAGDVCVIALWQDNVGQSGYVLDTLDRNGKAEWLKVYQCADKSERLESCDGKSARLTWAFDGHNLWDAKKGKP